MARHHKVLLMDLNPATGLAVEVERALESSLDDVGLRRESFQTSGESFDRPLLEVLAADPPDLIVLILTSVSETGCKKILQWVNRCCSNTPVLAVAEAGRPDELYQFLKLGLTDFITPPFSECDILPRVWRLLEQGDPEETLMRRLKEGVESCRLLGQSPLFLAELEKIPMVAACDAAVLISGETGTGKELFARSIHYSSARSHKPFVPVNCGAIPADLVENELFGHEKGSYTGATATHAGLIREADGGTLFLDEIDCLSPASQVKLLRFLQDKKYRSLGSTKLSPANVRIISATNVDLEKAVAVGKLRRDLYYRLNVVSFVLPALRNRPEDIPLLACHFLDHYSRELHKPRTELSSAAIQELMEHDWPGNVRELQHAMERAVVLSGTQVIQGTKITPSRQELPSPGESLKSAKSRVVAEFEKRCLEGLLSTYRGNISRSARAAQKNRRAFFQLIRKHQIDVQRFR